ncbi:MAG: cellulose biosynthesis protein BcsS [Alphaproteobacteria bacterium]
MRRFKTLVAFVLWFAFIFTFHVPRLVASELELYTGVNLDTRAEGYEYFGLGLGQSLNDHWIFMEKAIANFLHYEYDSNSHMIRAKAPGAKFQIGPKYVGEGRYFILTAGLDYRNTSLSHADPKSETKGARTGGTVEAIYSQDLFARLTTDLIINYSSIGNFTWGRGRLKYLTSAEPGTQKIFLGLEGIGQGNSDYTAQQVGALFELQRLRENFSISLSGGYKHSSEFSHTGYFGLEIYYKIW